MFKTKDGKCIDIEEMAWDKARSLIEPFNPSLVNVVDEISPGNEYKLYKASYPFGVKIIDKNESFLPLDNGDLISFNDPLLPTNLRKNLSYNPTISNPVGIVLDKKSECYLSIAGRVMPYTVMEPGTFFGLTRILDILEISHNPLVHISFFIWEVTSGARFIFMLPKITENISHNRLKKQYGLTCDKPKMLQDHWTIFKDIAKRQASSWRSSFLFFSNNWFERLEDSSWLKLYNYFLRNNRLDYEFWRNILSWQVTFNLIEQAKNLRFSSYTLDNAKHLFAVAAGNLPGFKPATNDDSAPVRLIQESYIKGYKMIEYWPVIMEPAMFNPINEQPVYYSLNYPTLVQSDQNAFKGFSIITLQDELAGVISKYMDGIRHDQLAGATSLYKTAQQIDFSYYHTDPAEHENIKDAGLLAKEDSRFKVAKKVGVFPKHAPFFKGCIKIAPKL